MKKAIIAVACVLAILAVGAAVALRPMAEKYGIHLGTYYVVVDNSRMTVQDNPDEMDYEYDLPAYGADGEEISVSFLASRELAEGAVLKLDLWPFLGVRSWEEADPGDVPAAALARLGV